MNNTIQSEAIIEHQEFNLTKNIPSIARNLIAYQVGDNDIVAAYDPAGAAALLCEYCGYQEGEFTADNTEIVSDTLLDSTEAYYEDSDEKIQLKTTLRQDVVALTEPTYMYGWE